MSRTVPPEVLDISPMNRLWNGEAKGIEALDCLLLGLIEEKKTISSITNESYEALDSYISAAKKMRDRLQTAVDRAVEASLKESLEEDDEDMRHIATCLLEGTEDRLCV